jgi:hypothetical protein
VLDEPKQTIEFVKAQNWYYRLCNHPIMAKIRVNSNKSEEGGVIFD